MTEPLPPDALVLRRPAQLRALRHPLRSQLVRVLRRQGEATVAEVAARLGRSPESLQYHVRALARAGLLEPAGERPGPGRPATVWRLAGREVLIDPAGRSPAFLAAVKDLYAAALRRAQRDVLRGVGEDRRVPARETRRTGVLQLDLRLGPKGRTRLRAAMRAFLAEVEALDDPGGEPVSVTVAYAPSVAEDVRG